MVKLYVEGGGDTAALKTACRRGFTTFITKAGIANRPRVVACGSRRNAYDSFRTAMANGEDAILLVDSEAPVEAQHAQGDPTSWHPWPHLRDRPGDGWDKPAQSDDKDCHLMVQCMESWCIADREALKKYFGHGFNENKLPASSAALETVNKTNIYDALIESTRNCKTKAQYSKGIHSFELLAAVDPGTVTAASPWAKRFINELKTKMDAS